MMKNSNSLISGLTEVGLSSSEACLYLAGLQNPTSSLGELQKLTQLKRPTLYHALAALTDKGLVQKISRKSGKTSDRIIFSFAPPDKLKSLVRSEIRQIKSRLGLIDSLLPEIEFQITSAPANSLIQYQTNPGLKKIIEIALFCKNSTWDVVLISPSDIPEFDSDFIDYCQVIQKNRQIKIRLLVTRPEIMHTLFKSVKKRILPECQKPNFQSALIICDDKIINFWQEKSKITASLITSSALQSGLSLLFENVWQAAK